MAIVKNMERAPSIAAFAFLLTSSVFFIVACARSWQAVPDPQVVSEYENCSPNSLQESQLVFVPGFSGTSIVVEDCSKFRRERVSIAMNAFEKAWTSRFGSDEKVLRNLRDMLITFGADPRVVGSAYDMDGRLIQSPSLVGQTLTPSIIWIYAGPDVERICDSSFIHELLHASIWAAGYKKGDPDHLGNEWAGWTANHNLLMQEVNHYLCVLGI